MSDQLQLGTVEIEVHPKWCFMLLGGLEGISHACLGAKLSPLCRCRFSRSKAGSYRVLRRRLDGSIRRPKWCPVRLQG